MIQNTHNNSIHRKFKVLCGIHLFLQIRTKHDFHLSANYLLSDYQTFLKQCKCLEKWMYSRTTQMTSKKLLRIKFNRKRIFQTKIPGDSLPASLFRRPRVLTFDSLWASWILTDQFRPTKSLSFLWLIWWYGFHPLRGATSCSDLFGYSMLFLAVPPFGCPSPRHQKYWPTYGHWESVGKRDHPSVHSTNQGLNMGALDCDSLSGCMRRISKIKRRPTEIKNINWRNFKNEQFALPLRLRSNQEWLRDLPNVSKCYVHSYKTIWNTNKISATCRVRAPGRYCAQTMTRFNAWGTELTQAYKPRGRPHTQRQTQHRHTIQVATPPNTCIQTTYKPRAPTRATKKNSTGDLFATSSPTGRPASQNHVDRMAG